MDFELAWQQVDFAIDTLNQLEIDYHIDTVHELINNHVMNICVMLPYLAEELQVDRYLEIGVRKGFSMCLVAAKRPDCTIIGFDMWIPNYANFSNPGPAFVRQQLKRVGYQGHAFFVEGDSHLTLPEFRAEPFPLILVDGDHTEEGAYCDIKNCLNFLDGYMVIDDLHDSSVLKAFERILVENPNLEHWQSGRVGIIIDKK